MAASAAGALRGGAGGVRAVVAAGTSAVAPDTFRNIRRFMQAPRAQIGRPIWRAGSNAARRCRAYTGVRTREDERPRRVCKAQPCAPSGRRTVRSEAAHPTRTLLDPLPRIAPEL